MSLFQPLQPHPSSLILNISVENSPATIHPLSTSRLKPLQPKFTHSQRLDSSRSSTSTLTLNVSIEVTPAPVHSLSTSSIPAALASVHSISTSPFQPLQPKFTHTQCLHSSCSNTTSLTLNVSIKAFPAPVHTLSMYRLKPLQPHFTHSQRLD